MDPSPISKPELTIKLKTGKISTIAYIQFQGYFITSTHQYGINRGNTLQRVASHYLPVLCMIKMSTLQVTDAADVSELEQLAQDIASKTQEFMAVLRRNGCALPSHNPDTARNDSLPIEGTILQSKLMELTTELQALVQGPRLHVHNQVLAVRGPFFACWAAATADETLTTVV